MTTARSDSATSPRASAAPACRATTARTAKSAYRARRALEVLRDPSDRFVRALLGYADEAEGEIEVGRAAHDFVFDFDAAFAECVDERRRGGLGHDGVGVALPDRERCGLLEWDDAVALEGVAEGCELAPLSALVGGDERGREECGARRAERGEASAASACADACRTHGLLHL